MMQPSELAQLAHTQLDGISSGIDVMFDDQLTGYVIVDGPIANLLCPPVAPAFDFSIELSVQFDEFKVTLSMFGDFALDIDIELPPCPTIDIGAEVETVFGLRAQAGATLDCMHGTVDFFAEIVTPPMPGIEIVCVQQPSVTPFIMEAFG
ncbi:MAG: hypothetical protein JRE40_14625, partial [Deltaproteobacteria bacterium]|nr:hypothetical protein [Deltaproteobacteria bacterium]